MSRSFLLTVPRVGAKTSEIIWEVRDKSKSQAADRGNYYASHAAFPGAKVDPKSQLGRLEGSSGVVLLTSVFAVVAGPAECSFIPSFRARIPSPIPLPSSGSFLGPNTNKRDGEDHQQMHRLEQAFKHGKTSAARGWQQAQQYRKRSLTSTCPHSGPVWPVTFVTAADRPA